MSAPVALKCPSCASSLRAEDLDQSRGIITCSYCRALMTVPESLGISPPPPPKPQVPLPDRISLKETMHGLEVRRRWFTPAALFLLFFCLIWDSFLISWYTVALRPGAPLLMLVFPLFHVAIGVSLTYWTLATLFNTTVVSVERGDLKVSHGPLPWAGRIRVPAVDLSQLYCKEKVRHGKNGPRYSYEVWGALSNGASRKLVAAGLGKEQALFIEQEIERVLGFKDRRVAGEMLV